MTHGRISITRIASKEKQVGICLEYQYVKKSLRFTTFLRASNDYITPLTGRVTNRNSAGKGKPCGFFKLKTTSEVKLVI